MAELERNVIRERTHAGLAAAHARARGSKNGRKAKLNEDQIKQIKALLKDPDITVTDSARQYAATHARAIADLVLGAVLNGGSAEFVKLDDWMPGDSDKQEVFGLLCIAAEINRRAKEKVTHLARGEHIAKSWRLWAATPLYISKGSAGR
jgi:hypothetical protein